MLGEMLGGGGGGGGGKAKVHLGGLGVWENASSKSEKGVTWHKLAFFQNWHHECAPHCLSVENQSLL